MNLTSATLKDLAYFAKVSGRHATLSGETCATIAAHIDAADDELAALRARVAELEADAERYRWMKQVQEHGDESVTEWIGYYSADQWDAEIDKHRAGNKTEVPK